MIISKNRMEYFSDGIIAIAITIMVLDIELTKLNGFTRQTEWQVFVILLPRFLIYLLSFAVLGIMWINHHTFYQFVKHANVRLLWYNLHWLFWLTLVPFATSLIGRYPSLPLPVAAYGFVMLMASLAFNMCRHYATHSNMIYEDKEKSINDTINKIISTMRIKINAGIFLYMASIPLAFISLYPAYMCIIFPAVFYMIPDVVNNKRLARSIYNRLLKINT